MQFARLLSEISAAADLSNEQIDMIAESMDLDPSEVHELFIRAENEFEALKTTVLNSHIKDVSVKTLNVNGFVIKANTDFDDHLTLTVAHNDSSGVIPMNWDAYDADVEWGERFTTDSIEKEFSEKN
ncbi:hypothetical protein A3715_37020 [Oleiphilus sp. HI0009]|nr:hypothetical protein A3715_37020 [Oleiphilus sp. HI0009]